MTESYTTAKFNDHAIRIGLADKIISINDNNMGFTKHFVHLLATTIEKRINEDFPVRTSVMSIVNSYCPTRTEEEKIIMCSFIFANLEKHPAYGGLLRSEYEKSGIPDPSEINTKTAMGEVRDILSKVEVAEDLK